ncbi:MAG: TetR/AcrR family transcriptional regulator [Gaiellales bacterium]
MPSVKHEPRTRTASVVVTDSLLTAALALLEERGLSALTVRAVSARAGVAPMGVYSRFDGKDGLLEALFVHGFATLQAAIQTPPEDHALDRLRTGCLAYRSFAIAQPHLYHLMFDQMSALDLSPAAMAVARATFATLTDRVHSAMASGDLTADDSTEVAQQLWSAMHGAVSLEIAGVHFAADRAVSFERMLDALLRGLER